MSKKSDFRPQPFPILIRNAGRLRADEWDEILKSVEEFRDDVFNARRWSDQ